MIQCQHVGWFGEVWDHDLLAKIIVEEVSGHGIDMVRCLFPLDNFKFIFFIKEKNYTKYEGHTSKKIQMLITLVYDLWFM